MTKEEVKDFVFKEFKVNVEETSKGKKEFKNVPKWGEPGLKNGAIKCKIMGDYKEEKYCPIAIDFDNKNDSINKKEITYNGLKLRNKMIKDGILSEKQDYWETTPNGGYHTIVFIKRELLKDTKCSSITNKYDGKKYHVDILGNKKWLASEGSYYSKYTKTWKEYKIINNKYRKANKKLEEWILINMKKKVRKVKKKITKEEIKEEIEDTQENIDRMDKLLSLIKTDRFEKYGDWIDIMMCCKEASNTKECMRLFHKYSIKVEQYKNEPIENVIHYWNKIKGHALTIATLYYYAKKDNYGEYIKHFSDESNFAKIIEKHENKYCINEKYLYNEKKEFKTAINDFYKNKKCMLIKSPMGTGKTVLLKEILKKSKIKMKRVLFLTHRIDFATSIYELFKEYGFVHYKEDPKEVMFADKVIISIESLNKIFKYNNSNFDLIIMDEMESLLNHFTSKTVREYSEPKVLLLKFTELIKRSGKIICMDAHAKNRTYDYISKNIEKDFVFLINEYKDEENQRTITCKISKDEIMNEIYGELLKKNNIVIPTMSKEKGDQVYDEIMYYYPELKDKIIIHNRDSSAEDKKKLKNVVELWGNKRVVIYTPTIEAGIDFNIEHFHRMFIFASSSSTSQRSLIQMLGRVRKLENRDIMMHVDANMLKNNNFPHVWKYSDAEVHLLGKCRIIKDDPLDDVFIHNYTENMNRHESVFLDVLKDICEESNIIYDDHEVYMYKKMADKEMKIEVKKLSKKEKEEMKILAEKKFNEVPNITYDEYITIRKKIEKMEDEGDEKKKYYKYNTLSYLRIKNPPDNIYTKVVRNRYKLESLIELMDDKNIKGLIENEDVILSNDIKDKIKKNKITRKLIELLGFENCFSVATLLKKDYEENVKNLIKSDFWKKLSDNEVNILFGKDKYTKKATKFTTISSLNQYINSLLFHYGISIKTKRNGKNRERSYYIKIENNIHEFIGFQMKSKYSIQDSNKIFKCESTQWNKYYNKGNKLRVDLEDYAFEDNIDDNIINI